MFVTMKKYKNMEMFLQKVTFPIVQKKTLKLKKAENSVPRTYVISGCNGEEIVGYYTKKNCKRQVKTFKIEKVIKRKGHKLYY